MGYRTASFLTFRHTYRSYTIQANVSFCNITKNILLMEIFLIHLTNI